jgi:tetratricopeptide (TPR) repeat protein
MYGKVIGCSKFLFLIIALAAVTGCINIEAANKHLNYGLSYIESGQYTAALKELVEAEKNNPRDPKIHYYIGVCYHAKGLAKEAAAEFKEAISLRPNYSEAHNYLGLIYTEGGQLDEAIAEFRAALANLLYETPSFAMSNLGWAYYKKGDYNAALAQYREILNRDPNSMILPIVERNIGIVLLAQGRPGPALEHLRRSFELAPDFAAEQVHYWIGKALAAQGKLKEAQSEFELSVKAAPNSKFAADSAAELEKLRPKQQPPAAGASPAPEPRAKAPAAPAPRQELEKAPAIPERPAKAPVEIAVKESPAPEPRAAAPAPAAAVSKSVPAAKTGPSWHVVNRGETLYSLARTNNVTVKALCSANNLPATYRLKIGERILIPAPGAAAAGRKPAGPDGIITYQVKPGDSLTSVAKKFRTTMADIRKLNNLKEDTLKTGQVLKVRAGE